MEIRGLGIVFIPDLFGPEGVREEMPIDLVCQLERGRGRDYDRWASSASRSGRGAAPRIVLPARPGGNMATVVEVAAREHRRRSEGVNAAARLDARLRGEMQRS
jgi:HPr kinase/phosphorylase